MTRIGLMGGSFNPIHKRHIELAIGAKEELALDSVLFIPTGNPPHKRTSLASAQDRYEMTRLAIMPYPNFSVSDIETNRSGTTYSVDTLKQLKNEHPEAEYVFIIGEDTLQDLPNWHKPDEVFRLCSFAVCCRSSSDIVNLPIIKSLEQRGARFAFLALPPSPVSSTNIRNELSKNGYAADVPPQVMTYIRTVGLYEVQSLLNGRDLLHRLKTALNSKRYLHSLLVVDTAVQLAELHMASKIDAEYAGLLHDCAKCMPLEEMQSIAIAHQLPLDQQVLDSGNLLHGPVGAVVARESYSITDENVLSAIACHTTGKVGMSKLDMILFLADKTESGRDSYPLLEEIRTLSRQNLAEATLLSLESSKKYVLGKGGTLYQDTDRIIRWLKSQV